MSLSDEQERNLTSLNIYSALAHLALAITVGTVGNIKLRPELFYTEVQYYNTVPLSSLVVERVFGDFPITIFVSVANAIVAFFALGNAYVWSSFYIDRIGRQSSPFRWASHLFSSVFLTISVAFLAGVRSLFPMLGVAGLSASATALLALSDTYSSAIPDEDTWELAPMLRLKPQIVSLFPFSFMWLIIIFQFFLSTSCVAKPIIPIIVFTLFVLQATLYAPMIFQLLNSPSQFNIGESRFIVLTTTKNISISVMILATVLTKTNFEDAIVKNDVSSCCFAT